jgi:predicted NUDIX family NTP pyrophosphohydrolase
MYRQRGAGLEVLLVHPGGPFWAKKDDGSWSIPKGLHEDDEDPFVAAKREFEEEIGLLPEGNFLEIGSYRQPGGKIITAWAVSGEFDPANLKSNLFSLEWPPKSGRVQNYPEVDRAEWFSVPAAMKKILKGQAPIIEVLRSRLEKAR